jgi:hypothetical protein
MEQQQPVYSRPKMKDFSLFSPPPSCSESVYRESWVYKTQLCCASNRRGPAIIIIIKSGQFSFVDRGDDVHKKLGPAYYSPFCQDMKGKSFEPPNVKKAGEEASSHFRRRQIQKKK